MAKREGRNGGTLFMWEPGQSGNPKGPKPGYKQARTILKKLLSIEIKAENPVTKQVGRLTVAEALHLRQIQIALATGDTIAYREIMDRAEGRPTQGMELSGKDGGPIETVLILEIPSDDGGQQGDQD